MDKIKENEKMQKAILRKAKKTGLNEQYFFRTTFDRYCKQLEILQKLEESIDEDGATVEKEYVKGRANIYTNPCIAEYNKTATAANSTVTTLISIIKNFATEEEGADLDDMMKALTARD